MSYNDPAVKVTKIKIGLKIKNLILARNITIEDFAEKIHIPIRIVNQWCSGEKIPDALECIKIAKGLNMTVGNFINHLED